MQFLVDGGFPKELNDEGRPEKSSDVVEAKLDRFTIADGLESFFVTLKVAKGWHVYANPVGAKTLADFAITLKFFIDGKPASTNDIHYPKGLVKKNAAGDEYRSYDAAVAFTAWLHWDETQNAKIVSVQVKVVATDGKTQLKQSIVTAKVR